MTGDKPHPRRAYPSVMNEDSRQTDENKTGKGWGGGGGGGAVTSDTDSAFPPAFG